MRTESLTVLVTDLAGFTARTSSQTREENERWMARHEGLVLPVVKAFGGTERRRIGDAFLLTFPSPTNAVLCATAIQDRLFAYDRLVGERERLEVRAVLTLGEVRIDGGEIAGEAVTAAMRLEGEAPAGEVWLTEGVHLAMNRAEVSVEALGERSLEGLPEPVRVYRVPRATDDVPPFGGKALERAGLPPLTEERIERLSSTPAAAIPRALTRRGAALGRSLAEEWKRRAAWVVLGAAALALGIALVVSILPGGPKHHIRALVDEGKTSEAVMAIEAYRHKYPKRLADAYFLEGYVAEHEGHLHPASRLYEQAVDADPKAYKGNGTIYRQMVAALGSADCGVRTSAARVLAVLGDDDAVGPLESALAAEAHRDNGILGGLLCHFGDEAKRAIATLKGD